MAAISLTRSEIVKESIGERIEIPGRQYVPYAAVAGLIFAFATGAPLLGLGLILIGAHAALPTEVKDSKLPPAYRRMYSLLAEDDGSDRTLEDMIGDAVAIDAKLARSVAEFVYENARRDDDGDWVISWKGTEYLVCDFFRGMFEHRIKEVKAENSSVVADSPKLKASIGNQTRLGAIESAVVPAIAPLVATPAVTPISIPTDAKTTEQLKAEFPKWFQEWCVDLVQKTETYTRLPSGVLQKIWLHSNTGATVSQFVEVLRFNLPPGATIKDGFIYLIERSPVTKTAKVAQPSEDFAGTQVEPTKPQLPLGDRILAAIGNEEVDGRLFVAKFVKEFGIDRQVVISELENLAKEQRILTDTIKKTMVAV